MDTFVDTVDAEAETLHNGTLHDASCHVGNVKGAATR